MGSINFVGLQGRTIAFKSYYYLEFGSGANSR